MIDQTQFAAGMAILAGNFGREIDAPVIRAYYAVLSPQITTEEFQQAVQRAMTEETYWPSAAVLLAKVKPKSDALQALADTEALVWRHGGYRYFPAEKFRELPAPVRAGISAAGGLAELRSAEGRTRERLDRAFVAAYDEAIAQERLIPVGHADRQLPAGSR